MDPMGYDISVVSCKKKGRNHRKPYLVGRTTRLKNMKVKWEYDIPNIWKNKIHVPNHQPNTKPAFYDCFEWDSEWIVINLYLFQG